MAPGALGKNPKPFCFTQGFNLGFNTAEFMNTFPLGNTPNFVENLFPAKKRGRLSETK